MSYSNPNVELTYDGDGSEDSFQVNFYYLDGETSVIKVELWDYSDPLNPVQQSFILNTDYTIDDSAYPATVVVTADPVPNDFKLIIYRDTVGIQNTSFAQGAFPPEAVEEALDRALMIGQEIKAQMGRAILNPVGGPFVSIGDFNDAITAMTDNVVVTGVNYTAASRDIVIVTASSVTITLPLVSEGARVVVKASGTSAPIVSSAAGIDGFGTSYTLSSSYQSVGLISDGSTWYII